MTEKTEFDPSDIGDVLNAIFNVVEEESKTRFESVASIPSIQKSVDAVRKGDLDAFFFSLTYPLSEIVDALISKELPNSPHALFLFKNSLFVEKHFERLIEKFDGSACCVDKTRNIMEQLLRFLNSGEEISFDYCQEYTYQLPVRIFNTHDEIFTFFKALNHLYYGSPEPYLQSLSEICRRVDDARTDQSNKL